MTFEGHSRIVMKEVPGRSIAAIWALARVNRTRNRAAREGPLSARQYQHLYQRHHRHLWEYLVGPARQRFDHCCNGLVAKSSPSRRSSSLVTTRLPARNDACNSIEEAVPS